MEYKKNTRFKILTPSGFKNFDGISKSPRQQGVTLILSNGMSFNCTNDHKIKINGNFVSAKDSKNGKISDLIYVVNVIPNIEYCEYYDMLEVEGHEYVSSDLISHNCEFLGSVATLVDAKYLKDLGYKVPVAILDGDRLRIYEYPKNPQEMTDKGFEYLITVDPAMGTMQDYSVCQVWLVESNTKIRQVAVYESNDIPPKKYIEKIYTLAKLYNEAAVIVETMEQAGGVIIDGLHYAKNYPNLIHMNEKGLGFNMSHNRKIEACVYLQVYMEKGLIEIVDHRTITQMSMFGKKGNTYKALSDGHDDLITPILAMLYYVNSAYFYGNIDEEPIYKKKTVAEEFSGIEEVTDENVRNIVNSWHDRSENEEYAPLISSPNNPHTFNNNHFLYGQDVRY